MRHFAARDNLNLVPAVTRAIVCNVNMPAKLAVTNDLVTYMMSPPVSLDGRDSLQQKAQTLPVGPIWKRRHATGDACSLAGRTPYRFVGPYLISPAGYGIGSVSRAIRVHSTAPLAPSQTMAAQAIHHSQDPTQKTSMANEKPRVDVLRAMSASKPTP